MATDYGPYTFAWSGPLQARVGRDYGVRARGYLFDDHLEYRASVMQGVRGENSTNDLRFLGRLMFNHARQEAAAHVRCQLRHPGRLQHARRRRVLGPAGR